MAEAQAMSRSLAVLPPESRSSPMPHAWKKPTPNPLQTTDDPLITIRKYIKWDLESPSESTDTVVLTTLCKYFIDVRILLPMKERIIDWAFAGVVITENPGKLPAQTKWKHWIDSETQDPETVVDNGELLPAEGDTIELGRMIKPDTGKMTNYEERWHDVEPILVNGARQHTGWVMMCDDKRGYRGMVIRVGSCIQGIVKKGDDIAILRRDWKPQWGKQLAGWRGFVLSKGLPEGILQGAFERVELFQHIRDIGNLEWVCVESFNWDRKSPTLNIPRL